MTSAAELLARAAELRPLISDNAERGERDRRIPAETLDALVSAGLFRLVQPRAYGGHELSMTELLEVCATVAEADGGTGWVLTLCNTGAWVAGLFPERAQEELWGADPEALICGALPPTSTSRKVDGGHRLTGRWYWSSGSWHASWAMLGLPLTDDSGAVVDQGIALVPKAELGFEDTWDMAGMQSTGSNCLIAEDVFVPAHRIVSLPKAVRGELGVDHPRYRAGFGPTLTLVLTAPQLGMGRAALRIVRAAADTKAIASTTYARQTDSVAFQLQLAEAATRIDTAHLHAFRAAADIDDAAARGVHPDLVTRARVRADTVWAIEQVRQAIELLLTAHGASGFAHSSALQRIWRDSAVAARHAVAVLPVGLEVYGKALLGRDDQITPVL
ncbi:acyl-CoA dehydrogenase family protein [Crossiella sp. CA-258035]|uniref:acyl-CoA dehydrogenase family protein n=1 Tax=Crossiella sp. CA-258035 TaxID=2981138 RepID=UPI0024BC1B9A|nr:acyl-CoA dehydrogenase family protein [Crossiella sp. CA-258035]WHT21953.1 acyl-CoA dehydrogenase family protein [Crossiella sp. CA-258035]